LTVGLRTPYNALVKSNAEERPRRSAAGRSSGSVVALRKLAFILFLVFFAVILIVGIRNYDFLTTSLNGSMI
jgi:preprotein translocase subunit SecG